MSKPGGGSAFPSSCGDGSDGMSLREYACIQLRVPETGEPWLDELIRTSQADWFAGQALIGLETALAYKFDHCEINIEVECQALAVVAYKVADAMQEARKP